MRIIQGLYVILPQKSIKTRLKPAKLYDKAPSGVDGALLLGDVLFNTGGSCSRW